MKPARGSILIHKNRKLLTHGVLLEKLAAQGLKSALFAG